MLVYSAELSGQIKGDTHTHKLILAGKGLKTYCQMQQIKQQLNIKNVQVRIYLKRKRSTLNINQNLTRKTIYHHIYTMW